MAQPVGGSVAVVETLRNLEDARKLVLAKPELYTQIVIGVIPLIGAGAHLHLRRWGAEFLAEAFSHPLVSEQDKESMAMASLAILAQMVELPSEDGPVVKAAMQALSSIYPFIFKHTEAMVVDATLYSINLIIRKRPNLYHKIINAVLNFNPLHDASAGMPVGRKFQIKSMEKTTKAFLINMNKRNGHLPLAGRIQQYLERLAISHAEVYDESKKRAAAPDLLRDDEHVKRAKTVPSKGLNIPPLLPGPTTLAQLFKITSEEALTSFHVEQLPLDMIIKITLPVLYKIDQGLLNEAINGIRSRLLVLEKNQMPIAPAGVSGVDDEDDEYEPDFQPSEDNEQILNKLDSSTDRPRRPSDVAVVHFAIPKPVPLTPDEARHLGEERVRSLLEAATKPDNLSLGARRPKAGLHRLAGGNQGNDTWKTIVLRLISRNSVEGTTGSSLAGSEISSQKAGLTEFIRNALYSHVMDDFRSRMILAFDWLTEEWYNDRLRATSQDEPLVNYEFWALKVLNGIFQYVDGRDKALLIRFLSELPQVSEALLSRFKDLAKDPERVVPVVNALYYLVLFRPPNKQMALDALEDLWRNFEGAGSAAGKLLKRYRPQLFEEIKPISEEQVGSVAVV
ncbi:MAG: hypothetical protein M1814_004154 [Vezdaea aestivalis]|nr:MAG: hypothetical protein M1814_004154 [Vezdaea aestivalis]